MFAVFCWPRFAASAVCGFHSVYATRSSDGSPVNERMATVAIDPMPDHNGQMLRNDLIDRFYGKGRPAQPAYHLSVKVHTSEEDLGLLANATTTLAAVHVYGDYVLKDAAGKTLISGTVQGTASYDKLASELCDAGVA